MLTAEQKSILATLQTDSLLSTEAIRTIAPQSLTLRCLLPIREEAV